MKGIYKTVLAGALAASMVGGVDKSYGGDVYQTYKGRMAVYNDLKEIKKTIEELYRKCDLVDGREDKAIYGARVQGIKKTGKERYEMMKKVEDNSVLICYTPGVTKVPQNFEERETKGIKWYVNKKDRMVIVDGIPPY